MLDLFGGSGNMSLEAISRGISHSILCDIHGKAIATIRRNIKTLGIQQNCEIWKMDYKKALAAASEQGRKFEDVVVHNAWFLIDIHNPNGGGQAEKFSHPAKPYDIPMRSLIPLKLENLLVAGRCISGTHRAHASYRVMAICMAIGEAAGVMAALCADREISPRRLNPKEVQQILISRGIHLFQ